MVIGPATGCSLGAMHLEAHDPRGGVVTSILASRLKSLQNSLSLYLFFSKISETLFLSHSLSACFLVSSLPCSFSLSPSCSIFFPTPSLLLSSWGFPATPSPSPALSRPMIVYKPMLFSLVFWKSYFSLLTLD